MDLVVPSTPLFHHSSTPIFEEVSAMATLRYVAFLAKIRKGSLTFIIDS